MEQAFQVIKRWLIFLTRLAYPVSHVPILLYTNASAEVAGTVLEKEVVGEISPVAFFGKQLEPAQRSYSAYEEEL